VLLGCRDSSAPQLRPVALPNLQPLDADVRQRIQERYAAVQQGAGGREADPGRAYGELGKILLAYGYLEQAEPALANARDLAPDDARWSYYLAHLYRLDGKPDRAAAAYEDALRLNADVPTRVRLAEVYRDLDRTAESRRLLGEALGQDSSWTPGTREGPPATMKRRCGCSLTRRACTIFSR
jgi:tetratricopeptide (TPR) repeat protein